MENSQSTSLNRVRVDNITTLGSLNQINKSDLSASKRQISKIPVSAVKNGSKGNSGVVNLLSNSETDKNTKNTTLKSSLSNPRDNLLTNNKMIEETSANFISNTLHSNYKFLLDNPINSDNYDCLIHVDESTCQDDILRPKDSPSVQNTLRCINSKNNSKLLSYNNHPIVVVNKIKKQFNMKFASEQKNKTNDIQVSNTDVKKPIRMNNSSLNVVKLIDSSCSLPADEVIIIDDDDININEDNTTIMKSKDSLSKAESKIFPSTSSSNSKSSTLQSNEKKNKNDKTPWNIFGKAQNILDTSKKQNLQDSVTKSRTNSSNINESNNQLIEELDFDFDQSISLNTLSKLYNGVEEIFEYNNHSIVMSNEINIPFNLKFASEQKNKTNDIQVSNTDVKKPIRMNNSSLNVVKLIDSSCSLPADEVIIIDDDDININEDNTTIMKSKDSFSKAESKIFPSTSSSNSKSSTLQSNEKKNKNDKTPWNMFGKAQNILDTTKKQNLQDSVTKSRTNSSNINESNNQLIEELDFDFDQSFSQTSLSEFYEKNVEIHSFDNEELNSLIECVSIDGNELDEGIDTVGVDQGDSYVSDSDSIVGAFDTFAQITRVPKKSLTTKDIKDKKESNTSNQRVNHWKESLRQSEEIYDNQRSTVSVTGIPILQGVISDVVSQIDLNSVASPKTITPPKMPITDVVEISSDEEEPADVPKAHPLSLRLIQIQAKESEEKKKKIEDERKKIEKDRKRKEIDSKLRKLYEIKTKCNRKIKDLQEKIKIEKLKRLEKTEERKEIETIKMDKKLKDNHTMLREELAADENNQIAMEIVVKEDILEDIIVEDISIRNKCYEYNIGNNVYNECIDYSDENEYINKHNNDYTTYDYECNNEIVEETRMPNVVPEARGMECILNNRSELTQTRDCELQSIEESIKSRIKINSSKRNEDSINIKELKVNLPPDIQEQEEYIEFQRQSFDNEELNSLIECVSIDGNELDEGIDTVGVDQGDSYVSDSDSIVGAFDTFAQITRVPKKSLTTKDIKDKKESNTSNQRVNHWKESLRQSEEIYDNQRSTVSVTGIPILQGVISDVVSQIDLNSVASPKTYTPPKMPITDVVEISSDEEEPADVPKAHPVSLRLIQIRAKESEEKKKKIKDERKKIEKDRKRKEIDSKLRKLYEIKAKCNRKIKELQEKFKIEKLKRLEKTEEKKEIETIKMDKKLKDNHTMLREELAADENNQIAMEIVVKEDILEDIIVEDICIRNKCYEYNIENNVYNECIDYSDENEYINKHNNDYTTYDYECNNEIVEETRMPNVVPEARGMECILNSRSELTQTRDCELQSIEESIKSRIKINSSKRNEDSINIKELKVNLPPDIQEQEEYIEFQRQSIERQSKEAELAEIQRSKEAEKRRANEIISRKVREAETKIINEFELERFKNDKKKITKEIETKKLKEAELRKNIAVEEIEIIGLDKRSTLKNVKEPGNYRSSHPEVNLLKNHGVVSPVHFKKNNEHAENNTNIEHVLIESRKSPLNDDIETFDLGERGIRKCMGTEGKPSKELESKSTEVKMFTRTRGLKVEEKLKESSVSKNMSTKLRPQIKSSGSSSFSASPTRVENPSTSSYEHKKQSRNTDDNSKRNTISNISYDNKNNREINMDPIVVVRRENLNREVISIPRTRTRSSSFKQKIISETKSSKQDQDNSAAIIPKETVGTKTIVSTSTHPDHQTIRSKSPPKTTLNKHAFNDGGKTLIIPLVMLTSNDIPLHKINQRSLELLKQLEIKRARDQLQKQTVISTEIDKPPPKKRGRKRRTDVQNEKLQESNSRDKTTSQNVDESNTSIKDLEPPAKRTRKSVRSCGCNNDSSKK